MAEGISIVAVSIAAFLTVINQISIVITAKQLWRQLEKLKAGILPKSETPNKILKSQSKYNQTILQDRLGK